MLLQIYALQRYLKCNYQVQILEHIEEMLCIGRLVRRNVLSVYDLMTSPQKTCLPTISKQRQHMPNFEGVKSQDGFHMKISIGNISSFYQTLS